MKRERQSEKGFTLIELTIVISIISLLAAIAVPNFIKFVAKARQSEAKTMLPLIAGRVLDYKLKTGKVLPAPLNPPAAGQAWKADVSGWKEIGFEPRGDNRYAYEVVTGGEGFSVKAVGNIDDDAALDEWTIDGKTLEMKNTKSDLED